MVGKPHPKKPRREPALARPTAAPRPGVTGASRSPRRYWLLKSEPESYGWQQFEQDRRTFWSGVRNYQARNLLRDEIKVGDGVLFYHSNADPIAVVGIAKVVREGYPDPTQFEAGSDYYDAAATLDAPRWFVVDIECVQRFDVPVTREQLKDVPELAEMVLLQRGSRLSVQPVTAVEWRTILRLGGAEESW